MVNTARLFNRLGIFPGEEKILFWSIAYIFFTYVFVSILTSVPVALFLSQFGGASYAYATIGGAVVSLIINSVEDYAQKKLNFSHSQTRTLMIIVAFILIAWAGFLISHNGSIVTTVLILSMVASTFATRGAWGTINDAYNLQQTKRLFGFITCGGCLSAFFTGILSPQLLKIFGVYHILLFAAVFAIISLLSLYKLKIVCKKRDEKNPQNQKSTSKNKTDGQAINLSYIMKKHYCVLLISISITVIFIGKGLDILFSDYVRHYFDSAEKLGGFFGTYNGWLNLCMLVLSLLTPWALKKFGAIVTLMCFFVMPCLIGIVVISSKWMGLSEQVIFATFIAMNFVHSSYSSLRASSLQVLNQAMPHAERMWVWLKVNKVVMPLGTVLTSLFIVGLNKTIGLSLSTFLPVLLVVYIIGLVISKILKKQYLRALTHALQKPYLFDAELEEIDKNLLPLLLDKLKSPYPDEVIFSLNCLSKTDKQEYAKALEFCFESSNEDIRKHVTEQIITFPSENLYNIVRNNGIHDPSSKVQISAYTTLASSLEIQDTERVLKGLSHPEHYIRFACIAGILKFKDEYKAVAIEQLTKLLDNPLSEIQLSSIKIISENKLGEFCPQLLKLTESPNLETSKAAVTALLNLKHIDILLTKDKNIWHSAIYKALIECGPDLTASIRPIFKKISRVLQTKVLLATAFHEQGGQEEVELLIEHMPSHKPILRQVAYFSLFKKRHTVNSTESIEILNLLKKETKALHYLYKKVGLIPQNESAATLRGLFYRFIKLDRERVIHLLSFVYGYKKMSKIKTAIMSNNADLNSYAVELLENTLSGEIKDYVIPFFASNPIDDYSEEKFHAFLLEILHNKQRIYDAWVTAAAIYYIGEKGLTQFAEEISKLQSSQKAVIKETAELVTRKLRDSSAT